MNKYLAILLTTSIFAGQETPREEAKKEKKTIGYYFFVLETATLICVCGALYRLSKRQPKIIERAVELDRLEIAYQDNGIVIKDATSGNSRFINCTFNTPVVNSIQPPLYPTTPE